MKSINPIFLTDSYKLSHIDFTSVGVKKINSNLTPRFTHYLEAKSKAFDGGIVCFGLQAALQKILVEYWDTCFFKREKEEVIGEAKILLGRYIGMENLQHFEDLHDLGYMPIKIKALAEGTIIGKGIPYFTITNTDDNYQWLPNYLESVLSAEVWKPMTTATIGRAMKSLAVEASIETTGSAAGADFQLHDFSFRGQSGIESGAAAGGGFLLSTMGTDNICSIAWMKEYYDADYEKDEIAYSVPAGEHSVTTLGIQIEANKMKNNLNGTCSDLTEEGYLFFGELAYADYVLEKFPKGIVSYVADSYDYFKFLGEGLPILKDAIEARDGKFVVRGDSGDPVEIICGIDLPDYSEESSLQMAASKAFSDAFDFSKVDATVSTYEKVFDYQDKTYKLAYNISYDKYGKVKDYYMDSVEEYELTLEEKGTIQQLFDVFGGHVNEKGYIELSDKIGMIYGDGITEERAVEIFRRLKNKGFATTNIVFGVGSYTLNMLSRDDLGTAVKATSAVVGDERIAIYKEPKTDTSKKSARGLLKVEQASNGTLYLIDDVSEDEEAEGMLEVVYEDGLFYNRKTYNQVVNQMKYFDIIWSNK